MKKDTKLCVLCNSFLISVNYSDKKEEWLPSYRVRDWGGEGTRNQKGAQVNYWVGWLYPLY